MLMLISRIALMQQNRDQNTLSRRLGTLGAGVCSECRSAEMHNPAPCPHVIWHVGLEPVSSNTQSDTRDSEVIQTVIIAARDGGWLTHDIFHSKWMLKLLLWALRWLTEDTFCRGISLLGSAVIVHQVRLHTWKRRNYQRKKRPNPLAHNKNLEL